MKEQETKKGLLAKLQSGKLLEVLVILILAIIVIIILYNAFYKDKEDVSASGKGDYATEQEAKLVSVQTRRRGQSAGNDQPCRRGRNGDRLRNRAKSGRHDRHDARARKRRGGRSGKAAARDCGGTDRGGRRGKSGGQVQPDRRRGIRFKYQQKHNQGIRKRQRKIK